MKPSSLAAMACVALGALLSGGGMAMPVGIVIPADPLSGDSLMPGKPSGRGPSVGRDAASPAGEIYRRLGTVATSGRYRTSIDSGGNVAFDVLAGLAAANGRVGRWGGEAFVASGMVPSAVVASNSAFISVDGSADAGFTRSRGVALRSNGPPSTLDAIPSAFTYAAWNGRTVPASLAARSSVRTDRNQLIAAVVAEPDVRATDRHAAPVGPATPIGLGTLGVPSAAAAAIASQIQAAESAARRADPAVFQISVRPDTMRDAAGRIALPFVVPPTPSDLDAAMLPVAVD